MWSIYVNMYFIKIECYTFYFKIYSKVTKFIHDKMAIISPRYFWVFPSLLYIVCLWRIDGCVYRIWRKVAKGSVLSFMKKRKEEDTDDNRNGGERKIGGK